MKILHLGGRPFVTEPMAESQRRSGHLVEVAGLDPFVGMRAPEPFSSEIRAKLVEGHDIIHLHRTYSVERLGETNKEREEALKHLASTSKLVYWSYDDEEACYDPIEEGVSHYFNHIFLGSTKHQNLVNSFRASWLPVTIDVQSIPAPKIEVPELHEIRVLYFADAAHPEERAQVTKGVSILQGEKYRFNFDLIESSSINDFAALATALTRADVLIESRANQPSCAALAFAYGTVVLGRNSARDKEVWPFSPVIDLIPGSITKKLEGLLKEPRSLRDLLKRSREYAENHHALSVNGCIVLSVYERITM